MSHCRLESVRFSGEVVRFVPRKRRSHQVSFPLEETDSELSEASSISGDSWEPESIEDIGPSEELLKDHEQLKKECWKDKDIEAIAQHAEDVLKDTKVCRRVTVEELLEVLRAGRFKSQFERREIAGNSLTQGRLRELAKIQNALYNYPEGLSEKLRPIHAIATHNRYGGSPDNEWITRYGDIAVYFKSHVGDFATAIADDSPAQFLTDIDGKQILNAIPVAFNNPNENMFPLRLKEPNPADPGISKVSDWDPILECRNADDTLTRYLEVQMHPILKRGKPLEDRAVGVEDIDRVVIREPKKLGLMKTLELIKELKERGIPWDVGTSEKDLERLR